MSMGGRAEGLACADPGARTPIGVSGNYITFDNIALQTKYFAPITCSQHGSIFAIHMLLLVQVVVKIKIFVKTYKLSLEIFVKDVK